MTNVFCIKHTMFGTVREFILQQQEYGIDLIATRVAKANRKYIANWLIKTQGTLFVFESLECSKRSAVERMNEKIMKWYERYRNRNNKGNREKENKKYTTF